MQNDRQMLTLLELLDALESKVNKDSHKSSKRPSLDGPIKKTRSLPEPSGKMAGSQTEHKGKLLRQIEQLTQVIQYLLPCSTITAPSSVPMATPGGGTVPGVRGADGIVPGHRTPHVDCALRLQTAHTSTFLADVVEVVEVVQYGPCQDQPAHCR